MKRIDQNSVLSTLAPPQVIKGLEKRKKWQEQRGKEFKIKKPRQLEPRGIERQAMRAYRERMNMVIAMVEAQLIPNLGSLLAADDSTKPELAQPKRDALGEDMTVIINGIKVQVLRELTDDQLRAIARRLGVSLSDHNLKELNKTLKTVVDIDVFKDEPFLQEQLGTYVESNVGLIKSVDDRYFAEIQEEVFRGARQGLSTQEISARIRERGKVAKSRADLIARDQINKFNGQLSKLRQTDLGVERYVWRTSLDERVRPEHRAREGKIYEWDDPPFDGNPGEPINCRCYAEPVLEDLVEETE